MRNASQQYLDFKAKMSPRGHRTRLVLDRWRMAMLSLRELMANPIFLEPDDRRTGDEDQG